MSRTTINVHVHTNEDTHTCLVPFDDFISVEPTPCECGFPVAYLWHIHNVEEEA